MKSSKLIIFAILFSSVFVSNAYAELFGVDLGPSGQTSPTNWTSATSAGTYSNLTGEAGSASTTNLVITGFSDDVFTFAATITASTIPSHTNDLSNIAGNFYNFTAGSKIQLQFTGLTSGDTYNVWVFGVRDSDLNFMSQTVSITGTSTTTYTQSGNSKDLYANATLGSSSQTLSASAQSIVVKADGTITITVTAGAVLYTIAGVAIEKSNPTVTTQAVPTLSEWGKMLFVLLLLLSGVFIIIHRRDRRVR